MRSAVRSVGPDEVGALAGVHLLSFPESALSLLGDEAVRRYYRWQLTGPHDAVALGAFDGAELVGLCVAGVFRGALSGFLRANRGFLVRMLATHPALLSRVVARGGVRRGAAAFVRARRHPPVTAASPRAYGILVVAVAPGHRRCGIGRALLLAAEDQARRHGHDTLRLTVGTDNEEAIRFYEAAGWVRVTPGRMERRIDADPARPAPS